MIRAPIVPCRVAVPGRVRRPSAIALLALGSLLSACTSVRPAPETAVDDVAPALARASATSVFGPPEDYLGSGYDDVGKVGLYPVRDPADCEVAILDSGEGSFAARVAMLKRATHSIRIQALVFNGDEAGLRIAELLKQKKAEGLDVRVIVDAFSNPRLQSQSLYFDLKQHGIEVEGYEALGLQWLNEVPVPGLMPHYDPARMDKRFHEKLWIIDAETAHGVAVTGGLNIGNEYFRVDPRDPAAYWRDQDVAVRGAVLQDLVAAFERSYEYLTAIKRSRGIFNTDHYWRATRHVLAGTGTVPLHFSTDAVRQARVAELESSTQALDFRGARCRFLHNRPRFGESYILQAYLKLIGSAREQLQIANAYFVPTPAIAAALKEAASRCVSVLLLSNSPETNDLPEITLVGRGHYKDLLAVNETAAVRACPDPDAGIRIWEWVGQAPGDPVRQGTMHSKFAVVDRRVALVGSYNLDPRSERLNSETALVFEDAPLAKALARAILDHDLRYSRPVTLADAMAFESPEAAAYRFRKRLGQLFEAEL